MATTRFAAPFEIQPIAIFTQEELLFAAMHHDLGKLGDGTKPYYLPQDSEWHRKNKNETILVLFHYIFNAN